MPIQQRTTGQLDSSPIQVINPLNNSAMTSSQYVHVSNGQISVSGGGAEATFDRSANGAAVQIYNTQHVDFSSAGAVALDVTNRAEEDADFILGVRDHQGNSIRYRFTIPKEAHLAVALYLTPKAELKEVGLPMAPNPYRGIDLAFHPWDGGKVNLSDVDSITISPNGASPATDIVLSNLRLLPRVEWNGILRGSVDEFGQSAIKEWPGKIHSESELLAKREEELRSYSNLLEGRVDKFGGSLDLPAQNATGHFRTEKVNDKWWLVTPEGHLYFMLGADEVHPEGYTTKITGREQLFQSIRGGNHYSNDKNGAQSFNFYTSNLERKYGGGWKNDFVRNLISRWKTWGLNALGPFSSEFVYQDAHIPFVRTITIHGDYNHVSTGSDLWGPLADPFDPRFLDSVGRTANEYRKLGDNEYFIGFVVDNEPSWVGFKNNQFILSALAVGTMKENAGSSPAKQWLLQSLQTEYGDISGLNRSWGTNYGSWNDLQGPLDLSKNDSQGFQADGKTWLSVYAERYYSTIRTALRNACPNALYFGNSYALNHVSREVAEAAVKHIDAFAFNVYEKTPFPEIVHTDTDYLDRPILITEFNFSSSGEGLTALPGAQRNQEERAHAYENYVHNALRSTKIIGCNFYLFADQPTASTFENSREGFVDTTDTPYPAMVSAIQRVARMMYAKR